MPRRVSRTSIPLAALLAAALACGLPGRRSDPQATQDFATATPGGGISVSLLTPSGDDDPALATLNPSGVTQISPIATATAQAAAAAAATATTEAINTRVLLPPATCPDPANPVVPDQPSTFDQYPEVLAEYLSLGGPASILEATLRSWGAITNTSGLVRSDRDFNADGVPEILLLLLDPGSIRQPPGGDLLLFGCQDSVYRLLYRANTAPTSSAPIIISADDLTGAGYNHLVYLTETCDGLTCSRQVDVIGFNLLLGNFVPFSDGVLTIQGGLTEGLGVTVTDTGSDDFKEIVLTSGGSSDPQAGPTRLTTEIWSWNGEAFARTQSITSDTVYRIHALQDADAALERGDFSGAQEQYTRTLDDPDLQSWTLPNESDYLTAFALYRLMLTSVVQGDQTQASGYFTDLQTRFPLTTIIEENGQPKEVTNTQPGTIYTELANAFWNSYTLSNDHGLACESAVNYTEANPSILSPLNSFGYANKQYTAVDICPFIRQ